MILKRGMSGTECSNLNNLLIKVGWDVAPSDTFTLNTLAAVIQFQRAKKLEIDGIVGPKTLVALEAAPAATSLKPPIVAFHNVPYFKQGDNVNNPGGTCGPTSISMCLAYHGIKPTTQAQIEDEIYVHLQQPDAQAVFKRDFPWAVGNYNPHNIHGMLAWVVKNKYKRGDKFDAYTWSEILTHLQTVGPCVINGKFTGSGHIICLVGMTADGDGIVNDPAGNWYAGYRNDKNGNNLIYLREDLQALLKPSGKEPYAHFIS